MVCVMTTGQAWQFRPYKWSEPKQLFHNGTASNSFHSLTNICLTLATSKRLLRMLDERPAESQNQGLECDRVKGELIITFPSLPLFESSR